MPSFPVVGGTKVEKVTGAYGFAGVPAAGTTIVAAAGGAVAAASIDFVCASCRASAASCLPARVF